MKIIKTLFYILIILAAIGLILTGLFAFLVLLLLFVVSGMIYTYFANRYSSVLRRKDNQLFMPIVEFKQEKTNKRITFLGCVHVGDRSYYSTLEHMIHLHPQALVMCEGGEEIMKVSQDEAAKKDYSALASLVGAVSQYTMQYQPGWIFNDLPVEKMKQLSNIMKFMRKKGDDRPMREVIKDMKEDEKKKMGSVLSWTLLNMNFLKFVFFFKRKKWRERVINHHIVHVRNKKAIDEVDPYIPKYDHIILLWGAGHLPGMKRLLKQRHFAQQSVHWIPAYTKAVAN